MYWLFDNADVLTQLRIWKREKGSSERYGKTCWLLTMALHVLLSVRNIVACNERLASLASQVGL